MFWQDKPKEIPSVLSGFTPAPDVLIKKYGFVTALIWGRVWRYCQGPQGECSASLETIAGELNMSVRNVLRDIKELCKDGYLRDNTPDRRNKPHVYADTGKLRIRIITDVEHKDGMTQSHGTMTKSHSQGDSESLEESIKKQSKKQKSKKAAEPQPPEILIFKDVVNHYPKPFQRESVIGAIQKINQRLGRVATVEDLRPFFTAWGKVSANDWSLVWLVDWAVPGTINGKVNNGNNRSTLETQYTPADYELAARIRAQRGLS